MWRVDKLMIRSLGFLYQQLLQIFPHPFRAEFGAEMEAVFAAMLADARRQGSIAVIRLVWREMTNAPGAILRAHRAAWLNTAQQTGRSPMSILLLPEIDPQVIGRDGRYSRLQATFEILPFLMTGALLLALTYGDLPGRQPGWQRQLEILRFAALFVALPVSLLGLSRGLPRWAYPWLGFLAGYSALQAHRYHMLWFLVVTLLTLILLALVAAVAHLRGDPLPLRLQWMAHSLQLDWTRLSFAVLGALPLVVLIAFDDGYLNERTIWLALSILVMILGAMFYSRSRRGNVQILVLFVAVSLSVSCALLNQAYFRGGLLSWLSTSGSWMGDIGWLMQLWLSTLLLLAAPRYAGPKLARLVKTLAGR